MSELRTISAVKTDPKQPKSAHNEPLLICLCLKTNETQIFLCSNKGSHAKPRNLPSFKGKTGELKTSLIAINQPRKLTRFIGTNEKAN